MNKLYAPILSILLLLFGTVAEGQEIDYTQYYLNLPGINPGFTGIDDYVSTNIGYRQGWNGFGIKNNNIFISAYGALGACSPVSMRKNSLRISDVDALEQLRAHNKPGSRQGIGGMVTSRTVGPYTSINASGNYAYHLPVSRTVSVSLGTRLSYNSQRIDFNGYDVRDPVNDDFYRRLMQSNPGNINSLSVDFGSVVYSKRFYVAFSTNNLSTKSLSGDSSLNIDNRRQFSMQSAYNFPLGSLLSASTGTRLSKVEGYNLAWTVNGRLRFKELVYVGAAYNSISKMSFLFGLCVDRNFTVNYSYDHYLAGVGALNVNVQEVVLCLALFNKSDATSKFW